MKKALVTGSSSGIGLAVAKRLAARGYALTLVARNEVKLAALQESLGRDRHQILPLDLTNKDDIHYLCNHLDANRYDLLINNAGNGTYGQFIEIPLEEQLDTMRLNMDALVTLSYAFLKKARSGDALMNVGSLLAHSSLPGGAVYAATKSFVASFSESLWYEFKNKGIFVAGFNPGAADSDFHSNAGRETSAFPRFVVSSVAQVADELINALNNRKKPRIVQGFKNRMMLFAFRFLSRKAGVSIMGKISPGLPHL